MVLSEYRRALQQRGVVASVAQIRFAISTGKLPQPPVNSARQFNFEQGDVEAAVKFFASKAAKKPNP